MCGLAGFYGAPRLECEILEPRDRPIDVRQRFLQLVFQITSFDVKAVAA
jgi:hypothetical protein